MNFTKFLKIFFLVEDLRATVSVISIRNILLGNLITLAHNRKHHKTKTFPNIFPCIFTRFPLAGNCIFKVSNKKIVYVNMGVVPLILNLLIEHRSKQFIVNFSTYFPDVRNKLHSSQMHVQNYD